jgi:hypothetical protein
MRRLTMWAVRLRLPGRRPTGLPFVGLPLDRKSVV